jgi:hypothetical protein
VWGKAASKISNLAANNTAENLQKLTTSLSLLEDTSPAGIRKAMVLTARYAGHMRNLTEFERRVLTKAAPFYAWTKYATVGVNQARLNRPAIANAFQTYREYQDKENANKAGQWSRSTMPDYMQAFGIRAAEEEQPKNPQDGQAISIYDDPNTIGLWMFSRNSIASQMGPYTPKLGYELLTGRNFDTDEEIGPAIKSDTIAGTIRANIRDYGAMLDALLSNEPKWNAASKARMLELFQKDHPVLKAVLSPIQPMSKDLQALVHLLRNAGQEEWATELKMMWAVGNRLPLTTELVNFYRASEGLPAFEQGHTGSHSTYLAPPPEQVAAQIRMKGAAELSKEQARLNERYQPINENVMTRREK